MICHCPCTKLVRSGTTTTPLGMLTSTVVRLVCPKCGVAKKSGKRSCCARGGAWFENCGDVSDTQFDHTWAEGIKACEGFAISALRKPQLQAILYYVRVGGYVPNTTQPQNVTRQQTNTNSHGSMSDAGDMGLEECVGHATAAAYIFVLCVCHFELWY